MLGRATLRLLALRIVSTADLPRPTYLLRKRRNRQPDHRTARADEKSGSTRLLPPDPQWNPVVLQFPTGPSVLPCSSGIEYSTSRTATWERIGRRFSKFAKSTPCVMEGICHRFRHPMSTAIWIRVLAQATILPNWIAGFSALVPFSLVSFLRVEKEERMMMDAFGDDYGEYQRRTGRLLPKIRPPSDSGS